MQRAALKQDVLSLDLKQVHADYLKSQRGLMKLVTTSY